MTSIIILLIGIDYCYYKFVCSEEVENREPVSYSTDPNKLGHWFLVSVKRGSTQWEVTSGDSSMTAQNILCASCFHPPHCSGRTVLFLTLQFGRNTDLVQTAHSRVSSEIKYKPYPINTAANESCQFQIAKN
jgi:hypothetical protein